MEITNNVYEVTYTDASRRISRIIFVPAASLREYPGMEEELAKNATHAEA